MADYVPTTWIDEVLADAERFDIKDNGGTEIHGNVQIALKTGVTQAGTAVDATRLNNIEAGIQNYAEAQTKSEKTTPVAADVFWLWDSVASALKNISWSGLQAALKTYFDTLYPLLTSDHIKVKVQFLAVPNSAGLVVADDMADGYYWVPAELNGYNLIACHACVKTPSSSGLPTYQIARIRSGSAQDILTTKITLDTTEVTSMTAATQPVINTSYDDVATGDAYRFDCDGAGTGTYGTSFLLTFQKP
jgi:hypothetical protein